MRFLPAYAMIAVLSVQRCSPMKITLASAPVRNGDIEFNLCAMLDSMQACAGSAELILFGESVLQGFDALCWNYDVDRRIAVSLTDEPIRRMREAAKALGIAVSFGFVERAGEALYSSQLFIGANGEIVDRFRRVSVGWKEYTKTDARYREGTAFNAFRYAEKTFATALCGDLWTDGRPEEMNALNAGIVLWPVWCDYSADEWNASARHEYAARAALCGRNVLLVNPYYADPNTEGRAAGAAAHFRNGRIQSDRLAGSPGALLVQVD